MVLGASTVKWTAYDPYPILSESVHFYIFTLSFVKEKNHKHF